MGHRERCPDCTECKNNLHVNLIVKDYSKAHGVSNICAKYSHGRCSMTRYATSPLSAALRALRYLFERMDDNPCTLAGGKEGKCRSGWCYEKGVI
ncbi:unnamed protein product [Ixodes persulcatus]